MSGTGDQAAESRELLGKRDSFLNHFQTLIRGFRKTNQTLKLTIQDEKPKETQRAEEKHGAENETQTECDDYSRCGFFQIAVYRKQRQGNNGDHAQARGPQSLTIGFSRR